MIELSIEEVATLLGLAHHQRVGPNERFDETFPEVSIDSRCIQPGDCFVAIKGKHFDGHDFVEEALRKGAAVVIHSRPHDRSQPQGQVFLKVDETTASLQTLARYTRKKWSRPLIAITGSVGKTTAKEFAASLLSRKFEVFKSPGNFNNEIGVPLSLLKIRPSHQIAVLELGMNHPGEIRTLSKICAPDAALLTNVEAAHLEFFSDLNQIAEAKGEILESLGATGQLFFNADDPRISRLALLYPGEKISFGLETEADVRIVSFRFDSLREMQLKVDLRGQHFSAVVPFAGKHFLYSIGAAVAIASSFGLSPQEIAQGVTRLKPAAGRGRVIESQGVTLWDDSYNSNPRALAVLLETVAQLQGFQRKILVLGEMLELGPSAPEFHRQAGRLAAETAPALLVTVGENGRHLAEGATKNGLAAGKVCQFQDSSQAAEFLLDQIRPGDLLLVKGSRGVRMDRVIQRIEEDQKI